jgi:UDP-N-acetylmuramate: L-alanyl-gamma-D-glutamyl-meso-diaminopimelate ligase
LSTGGKLIYCKEDPEVRSLAESSRADLVKIPYGLPEYQIRNGQTILKTSSGDVTLKIFGEHNLMNLEGARCICEQLGVSSHDFYFHITTFKGASKRLELIASSDNAAVYKDFAHSPSKLKATTEAVKKQFPNRPLIACMELHTFSSLNENFLKEYDGAMSEADVAYVYFNPHTIEHKKLKPITTDQVKQSFGRNDLKVYTSSAELMNELRTYDWNGKTLLLMTSGNFDGVDLNAYATELLENKKASL